MVHPVVIITSANQAGWGSVKLKVQLSSACSLPACRRLQRSHQCVHPKSLRQNVFSSRLSNRACQKVIEQNHISQRCWLRFKAAATANLERISLAHQKTTQDMEEWKSSEELDDHFTRRVLIKLPEEEDEEKEPDLPELNRAPTMKYDMQVLKTVNAMEEATFDELVALYEVESEDDLPVDFDIFKIIEKDKTARRQFLADMLADCPNREGSLEFIDKFLDRMKELNRPTAQHSAADSK